MFVLAQAGIQHFAKRFRSQSSGLHSAVTEGSSLATEASEARTKRLRTCAKWIPASVLRAAPEWRRLLDPGLCQNDDQGVASEPGCHAASARAARSRPSSINSDAR